MALVHVSLVDLFGESYRKIPRIRPLFDAQKFILKIGGGLICEDSTFEINDRIKSNMRKKYQKRGG